MTWVAFLAGNTRPILSRFGSAIFLAQSPFVEFADARVIQSINEEDFLRNRQAGNHALVRITPDMRLYISRTELTGEIAFDDDQGHRSLAPFHIRHADHCGLADTGMLENDIFDGHG